MHVFFYGMVISVLASSLAAASPANDLAVLENEYLKLTVSPVGARIISLIDKARNQEVVKNLAYMGGLNVIRFGMALNLDDNKDRYELTLTTLPDGSQKLVAQARTVPTDEKPGAALVTKEYLLAPGSSAVRMSLDLANTGPEEIGLIPWAWNLLRRGLKAQPEESHMTEYGVFNSTLPMPHPRGQKITGADAHYFPAANWSSRVLLPIEDGSNTVATVTRPRDMLKVYNWHRALEDFATLETIAAPIFAAPGGSDRWDYFLIVAAPIRNIVYCSPELVVGLSPHPTWLAADARELTLQFASTRDLADVSVRGRLVRVDAPDVTLKDYAFSLAALTPRQAAEQKIPVSLAEGGAYQLRLSFSRNGKPWSPGEAADDRSEVVIPLIAGRHEQAPQVFASRTQRENRLRQIEPQRHRAPLVGTADAFDAYAFPSAQRCFRSDTFEADGRGLIRLWACAGEYESAQVVLMPRGEAELVFDIAASPLRSNDGGEIACESVNDFLYVPVKMPSLYNALFRLGEYPEALLPTKQIKLQPRGNHPLMMTYRVPADAKAGVYRGAVALSRGGQRHEIPVELTVWNVRLPRHSHGTEYAVSLKGDVIPFAKNPDGTAMSRKQQLDAIIDMHLKYRLTPADTGVVQYLLRGDRATFEKEMRRFIDGGATKIYLGSVRDLVKNHGEKLPEIDRYLAEKGWTDYFYVRPGFDEASSDLIPQIKAACQQWKKLSRVKLMETYYHDDPVELYGWLDIWSRNPPVQPWMIERRAAGDTFWKVNAMPGVLEVEPWESGRRRYITLWDQHFTGSYIWTVKAWNWVVARWGEDYWCDAGVGNLAAVLMWPHESGILSTIRLEAMRDGLEDAAMLWMLRDKVEALKGRTLTDPVQARALAEARDLCESGPLGERIKSAQDIEQLRLRVGEALSALHGVK